jgi:hypothetical protein
MTELDSLYTIGALNQAEMAAVRTNLETVASQQGEEDLDRLIVNGQSMRIKNELGHNSGLPYQVYWARGPQGRSLLVHHYQNPTSTLEKNIFSSFKAKEGKDTPVSMAPLVAVDEEKGFLVHSVPNKMFVSSILMKLWTGALPLQQTPLLLQELYRQRFIAYTQTFYDFYGVIFSHPVHPKEVYINVKTAELVPLDFGGLRVKAPGGDEALLKSRTLAAEYTFDTFVNSYWLPKMRASEPVDKAFIVRLGYSRFKVVALSDSYEGISIYLTTLIRDYKPDESADFVVLRVHQSRRLVPKGDFAPMELFGKLKMQVHRDSRPVFYDKENLITAQFLMTGVLLSDYAFSGYINERPENIKRVRQGLRDVPRAYFNQKKQFLEKEVRANNVVIREGTGTIHFIDSDRPRLRKGKLTKAEIDKRIRDEEEYAMGQLDAFLWTLDFTEAYADKSLGRQKQVETMKELYDKISKTDSPRLLNSLKRAMQTFGIQM